MHFLLYLFIYFYTLHPYNLSPIVTIYISIHPLNHLYVKAIQEMLKIKNDWI